MTSLTTRAYEIAESLHRDQVRKGTQIPYLSHLLAVASLVLEDGGNAEMSAAALLHDAGEDQGGAETIALIRRECGDRVADLVVECSDSLGGLGAAKAPWRERKEDAIQALPTRSQDGLVIIAADKLHNARATLTDLEMTGPGVWDRFRTGRDGFIWYHDDVTSALQRLIPDSRSVAQLTSTMKVLRQSMP